MVDRVEVVAEAQQASLGSLRLQEKFNCVRAYEAIGARQQEFVKDYNKTTGKVLNVTLMQEKLSKWVTASRFEDWAGFVEHGQKPRSAPKTTCTLSRKKKHYEFDKIWGANSKIIPYA